MTGRSALVAPVLAAVLATGAASADAQQVRYYHLDAIGNVRALTNAQGTVLERHDYLPFGEECASGGCQGNPGLNAGGPRKFTGKERDKETGFDYFGGRYYGSKIGRFTTVDPSYVVSASLVDPQLWNRYSYVRNNPIRHTDPDGRLIDILADIAAIEYDLLDIGVTLYTGAPLESTHFTALGGDVLGAAVPFLTGVGAGIRAAKKVDNVIDAGKGTTKTATEMADGLSGKIGKNSVPFETPSTRGHIDLKGKAHFDKPSGQEIPTPHVQTKPKHVGPQGQVNLGPQTTRPATKADIRTAEKLADRKQQ